MRLPPTRSRVLSSSSQRAATLDLLAQISAILNADDIRAFTEATNDLKAARQRVTDEALDDAPLMETLRAARAQAAGVLVASRSMLDGVLRFENSPTDVDTFILRRKESKESLPPAAETTTETTTPETTPVTNA